MTYRENWFQHSGPKDRDGPETGISRNVVSTALVAADFLPRPNPNAIKGTKTGAVREVPVHPTLAAMLGEWLLSGFAAMHGGMPEPDDLLIPLPPDDSKARRRRTGEPIRTGDYAGKKWREVDLPMLGWRAREMYAMKSTFITLCGKDRASRDAIKRVTHAPTKRDAFDGYDRDSHWDEMCEAVAKLRLSRRHVGGKLVAIK